MAAQKKKKVAAITGSKNGNQKSSRWCAHIIRRGRHTVIQKSVEILVKKKYLKKKMDRKEAEKNWKCTQQQLQRLSIQINKTRPIWTLG